MAATRILPAHTRHMMVMHSSIPFARSSLFITLLRLQGYSMYREVMTSGNSALPEAFAPGWPSQAPRLGPQPNRRSPPLLGKGCRPDPCTIVKYLGCRILSFGSFVSQCFSHCANLTNSRCLYALLLLPQFLGHHSC
jgi:hypothetical protein